MNGTGIELTGSFLLSTSKVIAGLPGLAQLLGLPVLTSEAVNNVKACAGVIVWGRKPSRLYAIAYARWHRLPIVSIEDGFLRSLDIGSKTPPLSIVIDDLGIYYDAKSPSRLESLVNTRLTEAQQQRATAAIQAWRGARVSKYNHAPDYAKPLPSPYVLVVDQVAGDQSIACGLAKRANFQQMLNSALIDYPDASVIVKTHPDVISGYKQGHFDLAALTRNPRIVLIAEPAHPVSLLEHAQAVYCVTSQMGFEALFWGKPVHLFGMPFYAGYGLTDDRLPKPARRCPASLEQLVYAALIAYPRYLNPETGLACEFEQLLTWMSEQRQTVVHAFQALPC